MFWNGTPVHKQIPVNTGARCNNKVKYLGKKQGPQQAQKVSSLTSLKILKPYRYQAFSLLQPSEMAILSNYRWQIRKERQHRSTNNGYMVETAKRCIVCE